MTTDESISIDADSKFFKGNQSELELLLKDISMSAASAKKAGLLLLERSCQPVSYDDSVLIFPALFNIALAAEIQMKYTLLCSEEIVYPKKTQFVYLSSKKIKCPKIHNLKDLFNLLPEQMRDSIRSEVNELMPEEKEGNWGVSSFDDELESCSNYFEEIRYYYEQPLAKVLPIWFLPEFCKAIFRQDPDRGKRCRAFTKGNGVIMGEFNW